MIKKVLRIFRLIKAAPKLLAALKRFVDLDLETDGATYEWPDAVHAAWDARKLVALIETNSAPARIDRIHLGSGISLER